MKCTLDIDDIGLMVLSRNITFIGTLNANKQCILTGSVQKNLLLKYDIKQMEMEIYVMHVNWKTYSRYG